MEIIGISKEGKDITREETNCAEKELLTGRLPVKLFKGEPWDLSVYIFLATSAQKEEEHTNNICQ